MCLTPSEQEKLLIYVAAHLVKNRDARDLKLNHPEFVASDCRHFGRYPRWSVRLQIS